MSRYNLKPNEPNKDNMVYVGFDNATGYFFIQVFSDTGELIHESESTHGHILKEIIKFCDKKNPLTKRVFQHIMLDLDPSRGLDMYDSWEDYTQPNNQTTQTIGK